MIEVEIKLKIDDEVKLKSKILELGFKQSIKVRETDQYFNGVDRDFRKSDEALRIRRSISLEGDSSSNNEKYTLTYKGQKLDNVSMARTETEINIDNYEGMYQVLVALGFKPVPEVNKIRQYYSGEEMVICVDEVDGLGYYMEMEIMVDNEAERENALDKIEKMLCELGYSMQDTTTTSYLSMKASATISNSSVFASNLIS